MQLRNSATHKCCLRLASVFILIAAGCTTNPYTNRSQLVMFADDNKEMTLGAQSQDKILSDPKVQKSQDPAEVEPVQRVAQRIIEAAKRSKYAERAQKFEWEVSVIKDDETLNAMVLPGGKIFVYTGIFRVANNEAGLAAILGHEVTHALALHSAERRSQGMLAQFATIGLGLVAASQGFDAGLAQKGAGTLAQYGVLLPFSRSHESEADYIGLLLAADAGYDPQEAVEVWERMEQQSKGQPPQFLSTHPSHGTRIKQLQGWMNEALTYYHPVAGTKVLPLPIVGTTTPRSLPKAPSVRQTSPSGRTKGAQQGVSPSCSAGRSCGQ